MAGRKLSPRSGREVATRALATAAARFPDLPPAGLDTAGLSPVEASLAVAIHRTALRRWLTLEYLAGRFVRKPTWRLEPTMRGVLISGAAQLLFMDRLPAYAVVDEMVDLTRRLVRPKAAGMVNGVLRNLARLVARTAADEPWQPGVDRLPWYPEIAGDGTRDDEPGDAAEAAAAPATLHLKQSVLPDPADLAAHLSVAASMPEHVVNNWLNTLGQPQTTGLCLHSLKLAPTIVAVESDFDVRAEREAWRPHSMAGFIVWRGSHDDLVAFLNASPHRRVQDPASARPVTALGDIRFKTVLDYCAGRGTKTRQLAAMHRDAQVCATDINAERLSELQQAAAGLPNIGVTPIEEARQQRVDLLLLDVPCSNTAVLARRPEARYRLTRKATHNLLELQRRIAREALPTLSGTGHVLYSTCSVDEAENQRQARWLAKQVGGRILTESQMLPGGAGRTYHDGSYHALIAAR